jgi:hypothetical protein
VSNKEMNVSDVKLYNKETGEEVLTLDSATLQYSPISFWNPKPYRIDFSKVNTIEDIKVVLEAMDIVVYENATVFEKLKPYLKEA